MATPTQRYTDAWACLDPLWLNLTKSGVSNNSVSPPSSVVLYGSETWTKRLCIFGFKGAIQIRYYYYYYFFIFLFFIIIIIIIIK